MAEEPFSGEDEETRFGHLFSAFFSRGFVEVGLAEPPANSGPKLFPTSLLELLRDFSFSESTLSSCGAVLRLSNGE